MEDREIQANRSRDQHALHIIEGKLYVAGCDCAAEVTDVHVAQDMVEALTEWIELKRSEASDQPVQSA